MLINGGDDVTTHENIGSKTLSQLFPGLIYDEVVTES